MMKIARYALGAIMFLLVWVGVAAIVGTGISFVVPSSADAIGWRIVPGSVLGWWLGHQVFQIVVTAPKRGTQSEGSWVEPEELPRNP